MYCKVLITKPFDKTFTYQIKSNEKVQVGSVVRVPFGNKKTQIGIVYDLSNNDIESKKFVIKEIDTIYEKLILNKKIIRLIDWISNYTLAPKGMVLKLILVNEKIISHKYTQDKKEIFQLNSIKLNSEQKKAYKFIEKKIISSTSPIVLEGVTGSGKTEVYFRSIENILSQKKQILLMLPEISLTPQIEKRIEERFGFSPHIWHSKITEKQKRNTWHRCFKGEPLIVVGARSSLFLPFKNLGLIVLDEEHDLSYKQEDNIRYHARDLAIVRSQIEKIPIILSSATPSLETYNNIYKKKFSHINLLSQYSGLDLPEIELINLQKENLKSNKWISSSILDELKNCIEKKEQALLFLNRRGYSPLILCSDCGYRYHCEQCSSWLVMHRNKKRLLCHHCGTIYPVDSYCNSCKSKDSLKLIGPGVERLAEELKEIFPKYNIGIMSSDNANTTNKIKKIVESFSSKKIDILVATQIMAKGYHFPNLSFVGVIDADAGLVGGDMRAIEKTYNLLQQVSGRAGRTIKRGKVLIQTYFPNQPVIKSFIKRNRGEFVRHLLLERKKFNMPPFSFMTAIIISGSSKAKAESYSSKLVKSINPEKDIDILGPVEAPLFLLRGKYRYRLLLKSKSRKKLNLFTKRLVDNSPIPGNIRLTIDVDPYTFM